MTAKQVERRSVDLPPILGPVKSIVRGWWESLASSPRTTSLGTATRPFSPKANGCHSPLILSTGLLVPSLARLTFFAACTMVGLDTVPVEELAVSANDLNTSMQFMAWMIWDHSAPLSTNSSIRIVMISASWSVTSWFWNIICIYESQQCLDNTHKRVKVST